MNDVVADIARIGTIGQHFDPERVDEPRGFERFVPPPGAVEKRAPNRLGHTAVQVIDDRLYASERSASGLRFSNRCRATKRTVRLSSMGVA